LVAARLRAATKPFNWFQRGEARITGRRSTVSAAGSRSAARPSSSPSACTARGTARFRPRGSFPASTSA